MSTIEGSNGLCLINKDDYFLWYNLILRINFFVISYESHYKLFTIDFC